MSTFRTIISMLSPRQRWSALALFGLMLIGMVLETLGVGSVIPAVASLNGSGGSGPLPAWLPMHDRLAALTANQLVIVALSALVALFAVKAVFMGFLAWRQANFLFDAQADISHRLFSGYLRQSYAFHLRRNSAELIRNVMNEASAFTMGALQSTMLLATEGMVSIGLIMLLIVLEPVGAITVMLVLGAAGYLFLVVTRSRLKRWGEQRQFHEGQRIQHLQQGLGGAKDVKLLGRESHFLAQYQAHNDAVARVGKREMTVQALPRLWLELLAVIGLAGLVLTLLSQGKPLSAIVPTLGVFAAAAYRLVPSSNRILNGIQSLRYYLPVVQTLREEMRQMEEGADTHGGEKRQLREAIRFRNVSYSYPEASGKALDDIDFSVPKGISLGIIGGSGAGKSTLIDVLMGLLRSDEGTIEADGEDVQNHLRQWQDQFGYVPQSIFLTDDTLRRNVAFGIAEDKIDEAAVTRAVAAAQLSEFAASLPQGLETPVGERGVRLSGGQRQRIGIARALYHDPGILVLDEATSALDTQTELEVMRGVKLLRDKTIIIIAHRHSTVEHCQHIIRIDKGRIVTQGTAAEMLALPEPVQDTGTASAEQ
ncbi:MAG: ATPase [Devosia sp.]|uniref:ABC transporter ATP-binding protein n=1 Tax=Devosia sp. TaxID=1871048 RepID=UPI00263417C6|nr:ABC transporter ATP-binding protein [Devosia sp.]MDB5526926.1 ATPase [Devosia sp.]